MPPVDSPAVAASDTAPSPVIRRDVLVVGAGLAGAAAAAVLARSGLAVTIIDPYPTFPPLFRAEKIEPDQAALLQTLGLLDVVKQKTRVIHEIIHGHAGRVVHRRQIEQFGISYCDTVNQVRSQIPPEVEFKLSRVEKLHADAVAPRVELADGSVYEGRLVILASGMTGRLHEQLAVQKQMVQEELSMAFGFMLERTDGQPFAFDAVTYRPTSYASKVGYVTLFRMGNAMRANIFAYWPAKDASTKELLREPAATLPRLLPGLEQVIGDYAVQGKIEPFKIDLYRMQDCARPGVVLIGDAYQSVCPSTGTGLSKVLNDVQILCQECVPQWLKQPAIPASTIAGFYEHARKNAVDDHSLQQALRGRMSVLDNSLHWKLRRLVRGWRFAHGV
jgi:2-polyprenyl-6-methoxyphenol hydroxylase-like FAD-dependent oxidoreductase